MWVWTTQTCISVKKADAAMPGGDKYRRWYAMRQRLITEGKWLQRPGTSGDGAESSDAAGNPADRTPSAAKKARLADEGTDSDSDSSIPALESSPTAEGTLIIYFIYSIDV